MHAIIPTTLPPHWVERILTFTRATEITHTEVLQSLWRGYGGIFRLTLEGSSPGSLILKYVSPPPQQSLRLNQAQAISHQRKLKSYEIEMSWYRQWGLRCNPLCRIPQYFGSDTRGSEHLILLEDLDQAGFDLRREKVSGAALQRCLTWLAHFHARFLGESATGLWPIGGYWHLGTRTEELASMPAGPLKVAAQAIDQRLNAARYQGIIHGDAKVENFCFAPNAQSVAAVDFQYVGGGCGMKDVVYLLSGLLDHEIDPVCAAEQALEFYFVALKTALQEAQKALDFNALEREWRMLYPIAWADFLRFLQGWMPGRYRLSEYDQQQIEQALRLL